MSQKTNPNTYRYGINKNWVSRWTASNGKELAKMSVEDRKIRNYLLKKYHDALIDKIEIERKTSLNSFDKSIKPEIFIFIRCVNVGIISVDQEKLNEAILFINKVVGREYSVKINPLVFLNQFWSARIIARKIADDIENRIPFRVAQKNMITQVMKSKILGIKTKLSGRLNGVDMARCEGYSEGLVPISTIRCDLDYALEEAHTVKGVIGVKVWLNRGQILDKGLDKQNYPTIKPTIEKRGEKGGHHE
ncbi:MAG: 30S ribosomal protein S3 [Mycoplasmataceae bacterium]|nr:30S ribosomal protein S3 [Mycoplasmataceae bacterium]